MATSGEATNRQLVKLREFSTQLAQRLKEAPNKPVEPTRLAIRIGSENYLIEMALAGEIVSLPEISAGALDAALVSRTRQCARKIDRCGGSSAPDGPRAARRRNRRSRCSCSAKCSE